MIRDLVDDQVVMEVMTTRIVRRSRIKAFNDIELVLHHIPERLYFGFDQVHYAGSIVPVSDPEKTIIDLLYYRIGISRQDYLGLIKAIDRKRLVNYLKEYDSRFSSRVIRFFDQMRKTAISGELENWH